MADKIHPTQDEMDNDKLQSAPVTREQELEMVVKRALGLLRAAKWSAEERARSWSAWEDWAREVMTAKVGSETVTQTRDDSRFRVVKSYSPMARALLTPDEVKRMPDPVKEGSRVVKIEGKVR